MKLKKKKAAKQEPQLVATYVLRITKYSNGTFHVESVFEAKQPHEWVEVTDMSALDGFEIERSK